jgi:AraC family transcriptional regulator
MHTSALETRDLHEASPEMLLARSSTLHADIERAVLRQLCMAREGAAWEEPARRIASEVIRLVAPPEPRPGHKRRGGLAPWQEKRCCDFIDARLAEEVPLAELAALVRLSPYHFARQFKHTVGLPPLAYQRRQRCRRAQELLLATDWPIGDIAAEVGYDTQQAFARMFRSETGLTPRDWRRLHRA